MTQLSKEIYPGNVSSISKVPFKSESPLVLANWLICLSAFNGNIYIYINLNLQTLFDSWMDIDIYVAVERSDRCRLSLSL